MTTINLRDFYYWYLTDEPTHQRRMKSNKAQYSLDVGDGIEYAACEFEPSAQELLERKEELERLCRALNSLPETQERRIDACIILGKNCREVAQVEDVDEESVRQSIKRDLDNMRKVFKIFSLLPTQFRPQSDLGIERDVFSLRKRNGCCPELIRRAERWVRGDFPTQETSE